MYTVPAASGSEQPTENPTESLGTGNLGDSTKAPPSVLPDIDLSKEDNQQPSLPDIDLSNDKQQEQAPNPMDKAAQAAKYDAHTQRKPDISTFTGFKPSNNAGLNPDYTRSKEDYHIDATSALHEVSLGAIPILSKLTPQDKDAFTSAFEENYSSVPKPQLQLAVPDMKGKVEDVMSNVNKVNSDISSIVNDQSITKINEKIKGEKPSEDRNKDIYQFNELLNNNLYYNIVKKYGATPASSEQISSDLQDEANQRKYKHLQDAGYANAVDKSLPEQVQHFLRSSEWLNSMPQDKSYYARMLYQNYVQKGGTPVDEFYDKIKGNFTPPLNAMLMKQTAQALYPQIKQLYDSSLKETRLPDFGVPGGEYIRPGDNIGGLGENATFRYKRALDLVSKIISSPYDNENSWRTDASNSIDLWNGMDAIPFLGQINGMSEALDDNRVVNKVKNKVKLTPDEELLYKSHALANSFAALTNESAVTKIFDALPSSLAFITEFGLTGGASKYATNFAKGAISKGLTTAAEKALPAGVIESMRAVGELSPALKNAANLAIKPFDFTATKALSYTTHAALAQPFGTIKQGIENLTDVPNYDVATQTEELSPKNETVVSAFTKAIAQNVAQVGVVDLGQAFEYPQNKLLQYMTKRYPKASPWLNILTTNELAEHDLKNLAPGVGIDNPVARMNTAQNLARSLGIGSLPGESFAWGYAYPRIVNHIYGYQDSFMPSINQVEKDVSNMGGLVGPMIVGRMMGIGQSLYYRNAYKGSIFLNDALGKMYDAKPEDFSNPDFIQKMKESFAPYAASTDKNSVVAARLARAMLQRAQDHYSGGIQTSDGAATKDVYGGFKEYMDSAQESQQNMNALIKSIRDGNPIAHDDIDLMKQHAPDKDMASDFQFHKDLIDSYNQTPTSETLDQYVSKHKAEYRNIDNTLDFYREMSSVPNFKETSDKIDNLPLPDHYKNQLRDKMNFVQQEYIAERKKYAIPEDIKPDQTSVFHIPGEGADAHTFIRDNNGEFRLKSTNPETFMSDITHEISKMSNENLSALHNVVQNSQIPQQQKVAITEAVKDKLVNSFKGVERFDQVGGANNFGQLIYQLNTIAKQSQLSEQQKTALGNTIGGILTNEIAKDYGKDNLEKVRSVLSTMLQNTNIYHPHEAITFFQNLSRQINRIETSRLSFDELKERVTQGDQEAVTELETRLEGLEEGTDQIAPKIKEAIDLIKNKDLKQSPDFKKLIKDNKDVEKLSKAIDTLVEKGKISENGRILMQAFVSGLPIKHIKLRSVDVQESEDENTRYEGKSIKIRYGVTTSESKIISDIAEEIRHNIHHQLGVSIGRGGLIGDFVMSDADVKAITGSNRVDALSNIARWYSAKDYQYSEWQKLHGKYLENRLSLTDEELALHKGMTDMLDFFRTTFNQPDRYTMDFSTKNRINPLGLNITSEQLVRNYDRFMEFRKLGHTRAFAAYYSLTPHEYFAKTFGDSDLQDVSQRLAGDKHIEGIFSKMHDWASKYVKVPMLQRMFRSDVFQSEQAKRYLSKLISPIDLENMIRVTNTPDAFVNGDVKDDMDRVAGDVTGTLEKPVVSLREKYREHVLNQDLDKLNDLYKSVSESSKTLGHNESFSDDILSQIIKDSGLTASEHLEKENEVKVKRHSDTDEVDKKLNDSANEPLNKEGKQQAKTQGKEFKREGVTRILHSPLERAKETAQIAGKASKATLEERPGLRTWDMGDLEGKPEKDFDEAHYVNHPDEKVPNGESFNEFKERSLKEKEELKTIADKNTGVISHSKVMNLWDAIDKNGEWNDAAKKEYLEDKNPSSIKFSIGDKQLETPEIKEDKATAPNWNVGYKNMSDYIKDTQDVIHSGDKSEYDADATIGTFAGERGLENIAKTDKEKYFAIARQLELKKLGESGNISQELQDFVKYGWFKEKLLGEQFYKREIDDSKMKFNEHDNKYHQDVVDFALRKESSPSDAIMKGRLENSPVKIPLENVISHSELFENYPELRSMPVKFIYNEGKEAQGWYDRTGREIVVNTAARGLNLGETLVHEIQHHIQREEGAFHGTSPEAFKGKEILYNIYLRLRNGDESTKILVNENKELQKAMVKISQGEVPNLDMSNLDIKLDGKILDKNELYSNSLGEGEANNVGARYLNPEFKDSFIPTTLAQTVGYLDNRELIPNRNSTSLSIGSYKGKSEYNPVDVAWFNELIKDKNDPVGKENLIKAITSIDDNYYKYSENTKDALQNASEKARDLVELWKQQVIKTGLPDISRYKREEITRLLQTPFRKTIQDYLKDIKFIDKFVNEAGFRASFDDAQIQQNLARNRFLRNNKDNVPFYSAVSKLSNVNLKMFTTAEELKSFSELANTRIENTNIQSFIDKSNEIWKKYQDWKTQYNDQYESDGVPDTKAEDNAPLKNAMMEMRRNLAKETLKTQFQNQATSAVDKKYIDLFTQIDPRLISDKDFAQLKTGDNSYESILKQLLLNPSTADHKLIKFVNKLAAGEWYDEASNEVSKKYIELLNKKSEPNSFVGKAIDNIKAQFPFSIVSGDRLGNISMYNLSSILEISEGLPKIQDGILRQGISNKLDENYNKFLVGMRNALTGLSPSEGTGILTAKGKYRLSDMHLIGMHGLLHQMPDLQVTGNTLEYLSNKDIDIDNIALGQVLTGKETNPNLQAAYGLLNGQVKEHIKGSILASFGVKPSEEWTDEEIDQMVKDTSMRSLRSRKQIKAELDEILKDSGHEDLKTLVDNIENGTHELTPEQQKYLDLGHQKLQEVYDGVHSSGVTLPDAATKFDGVPFFHVDNYWPILRYKSYSTVKDYFDPTGENKDDNKIFYGLYSDMHMSTGFLEKRKQTIMSLNTNAYETLRKRIEDQVFYLNHIEHQTKLYDILATPMFHSDQGFFNTDLSNFIVKQLNGYFNRGMNPSLSQLRQDPGWQQAFHVIDNFKALVLGDFARSPSILSAAIFSMSKLDGSVGKRLEDMKIGGGHMVNSYVQGEDAEKFLREHAPEVYYRGLSAYDIATYESETGETKSGLMKDFLSNRVKGTLSGMNRGLYTDDRFGASNVARELAPGSNSNFGRELNLAGLVFHHRVAARTAFFAIYKNYLDRIGEEVDFNRPNQDAVSYAINGVRETQNTDNPVHKSGLAYNNIAGAKSEGDIGFLAYNLLAFKSYAVNERQTLMKANERMVNAFQEGDWNEFGKQAKFFAYSFMSKMAFNYIKLFAQKYTLATVAASINATPNETVEREIDNATSLGTVSLHTILDYYAFNGVSKWATSLAIHEGERRLKGEDQLQPWEQYKYDAAGANAKDWPQEMGGLGADIVNNLVKGSTTVASDWNKYGLRSPEFESDAMKQTLIMYQYIFNTLPGGPTVVDLINEVDRQRAEAKKGSSGVGKINLKEQIKGKSLKEQGLSGESIK